jgi:fatty acid desaturase
MTESTATASERRWRAALTREEIDGLLAFEDWRSWLSIAVNWGLVAASFALVAWLPHVLTVIAALFVIGARQLGLAVLMHEAAHRTLLSDRRWNDAVGNWLCAYPVWSDLHNYRRYHLAHHAWNWTKDDPDLGLATALPVSRASLRRKIFRDLSGQTGLKFARAALRRSLARRPAPAGGKRNLVGADGRRAFVGMLATNGAMLALLGALGRPELWLLWAGAWLTTNTLVTRIRSIAEHSMIDDPADPLRNTRTTLARWWERLLLAPNRVNFHLEHHLLMMVPHYHLPRMHRLLAERGVLEDACVERGYLGILRRAGSLAGRS